LCIFHYHNIFLQNDQLLRDGGMTFFFVEEAKLTNLNWQKKNRNKNSYKLDNRKYQLMYIRKSNKFVVKLHLKFVKASKYT